MTESTAYNVYTSMTIKQCIVSACALILLTISSFPVTAEARFKDDVAGWVPYWTSQAGVEAVIDNLDEIDIVYLFVYEVDANGKLENKVDFKKGAWKTLIEEAKEEDVLLIPTVAWFDGAAIHAILSDDDAREELIEAIEDMVDDEGFDGVNIDFEQKYAITIDYFSDFLKELKSELRRDYLTCAIEARTPPQYLYRPGEMPETILYANDYKAINKHCDWVEIMAYDQMRADVQLNNERRGVPYNPVADIDWVEKVLELALKDIDADKIMLGVATYGRAFDVTVASEWYRDYTRVASVNYDRILELSKKYEVTIGRTAGGEGFISYFPDDSVYAVFNQLPTPEGTPVGYEAAAKALLVATIANVEIPVRIITFGDARAAEDKLDLVKKYDLKGAAFFKFDGSEDEDIWDLF